MSSLVQRFCKDTWLSSGSAFGVATLNVRGRGVGVD